MTARCAPLDWASAAHRRTASGCNPLASVLLRRKLQKSKTDTRPGILERSEEMTRTEAEVRRREQMSRSGVRATLPSPSRCPNLVLAFRQAQSRKLPQLGGQAKARRARYHCANLAGHSTGGLPLPKQPGRHREFRACHEVGKPLRRPRTGQRLTGGKTRVDSDSRESMTCDIAECTYQNLAQNWRVQ